MTPDESTQLRALNDAVIRIESTLKASRDERRAADKHTAGELTEIKAQAIKTNGRVNALEAWRDRAIGFGAAVAVIWGVATDIFGLLPK